AAGAGRVPKHSGAGGYRLYCWCVNCPLNEPDLGNCWLTLRQRLEKMNIKVIHSDQINPYLLSATEESKALQKHRANAGKLTVPRRPKWHFTTTPAELERSEKESFLDWRRGLADLQENNDLLLTPFE